MQGVRMTAAERLVAWAFSLQAGDVPGYAREAAALHVLDGIGCAAAAWRTGAARPAVEVASRHGASAEATILGSTHQVAAPYAALANGSLVHALDYDDTHPGALVHATSAVLPAWLAVAQRQRLAADEMLVGLVAGYEAVIRLGMAVPHGFHARGHHATSVCGVFASALVAARLMGLTQTQAVNALGIAGSMAAGSLEFLSTGSDTKKLHPGMAAMAGITATELAHAGASGPASIFEGQSGLFAAYTGATVQGDSIFDDLGVAFRVAEVAFKRYPVCQLSQPSLDALSQALPLDTSRLGRVEVEVPADSAPIIAEPVATKVRPRTAYEAKFSVQWCSALLLVDGVLDLESFDNLERGEVASVANRVVVTAAPASAAPATLPGRVVVHLVGGPSSEFTAPATRVLDRDKVLGKFAANVGRERRSEATALGRELLGPSSSSVLTGRLDRLAALVEPVAVPC